MSDPFLGEIRIFAGNFAPFGWALCNGQVLPISQNTALFAILGTSFGGNGTSNFSLPNLQGSVAVGMGQGPGLTSRVVGETGGEVNVTLIQSTLPAHNHPMLGRAVLALDTTPGPTTSLARPNPATDLAYQTTTGTTNNLNPGAVSTVGGSEPHNNLQPYLVLSFIIALTGIFPTRN